MTPPFCRLTDRRQHRRRLQPVEAGLEAIVVARAGAAADEGQNFVRRSRHQARSFQAGIARLDNLRGCPDQNVSIPDRRHAMVGYCFDANGDGARAEIDRHDAL